MRYYEMENKMYQRAAELQPYHRTKASLADELEHWEE